MASKIYTGRLKYVKSTKRQHIYENEVFQAIYVPMHLFSTTPEPPKEIVVNIELPE